MCISVKLGYELALHLKRNGLLRKVQVSQVREKIRPCGRNFGRHLLQVRFNTLFGSAFIILFRLKGCCFAKRWWLIRFAQSVGKNPKPSSIYSRNANLRKLSELIFGLGSLLCQRDGKGGVIVEYQRSLVFAILWRIWQCRNDANFSGKAVTIFWLLRTSLTFLSCLSH